MWENMPVGSGVVATARLVSNCQVRALLRCPCHQRHPLSSPSFETWKRSARCASAAKGVAPIVSFFKFGSPAPKLPEVVEAGDPVLNEVATPVPIHEITSEGIQRIIDDMISVMRTAPGVGLSAPQLGIPLQVSCQFEFELIFILGGLIETQHEGLCIIVLEDTKEYISYVQKEETDAQQRSPFDLLVICNPTLKKKGNKIARFFEGCLSINGYRGLVERHLEVEVSGFGRDGLPIKVEACGWQARILQHECDHLKGVLYVDRMIPKTFRTINNFRLPLPAGCPKPGIDVAPRGSSDS